MIDDSILVQTFRQAMVIWDAQAVQGVPLAARVKGLSQSLRAAWPGQTRPWKYLCQQCDDYGLVMQDCDGQICGLAKGKPHLPHEYGTPCWCAQGARYRSKSKPQPEDFASAGKVTKPTRIGR